MRVAEELQQWRKCGENIRIARENGDMSVRELARRVGVSASHISQVERGLASFSVPALYNVANELGISMDSLFEDPEQPSPQLSIEDERKAADGEITLDDSGIVLRKDARPSLDLTKGPTWERLTSRPENGSEFIEVIYEPATDGANPPSDLVQHNGREYGIIIEGELNVQVGMGFTVLSQGDSISFDCNIPHRFWNSTANPVRAIWFISELAASEAAHLQGSEYLHVY
jgi:transcriptional regulator with XRE-family HTH domain